MTTWTDRQSVTLRIPDEFFTESDSPFDAAEQGVRSRLLAPIHINGMSLHLEAWPVKEVGGIQEYDGLYPEDWERLLGIYEPDGPYETTTINGGEYVLVAVPYST